METIDYEGHPLWRVRAALVENVKNLEDGSTQDFWFWFAAHHDRDEWLAHAVSTEIGDLNAAKVLASVVHMGGDIDVFLAYMGEPWDVLTPLLMQHAQMQRDLVNKLYAASGEMNRLRALTRGEILNERAAHEISVITRTDINEN